MTTPREWPTNAAEARDEAAEHVNDAAVTIEKMIPTLPADRKVEMYDASVKLQKALRLLEQQGAKTRPIARLQYKSSF